MLQVVNYRNTLAETARVLVSLGAQAKRDFDFRSPIQHEFWDSIPKSQDVQAFLHSVYIGFFRYTVNNIQSTVLGALS